MKILKKIITFVAILTLMSGNLAFAGENNSSCKEEIIENASNPVFSPDGKSFAYIGYKDDGKIKKFFIIKDGIEIGKEYETSYFPIYSPDGKEFTYLIVEKDGKQTIIKNGKKIGTYKDIYFPTYSPDGKSFAYIVEENGKKIIVKDGIEIGKEYDGILVSMIASYGGINTSWGDLTPIIYSPDGKNFAYIARKNGKIIIVKDGIESDTYDSVSDLTYSSDGKSFSYVAIKSNKKLIIKDNLETSKEYQYSYYPIYSPDGKEFTYLAKRKDGQHFRQFIVKNGIEFGKEYESVYGPLIYSPDGKSFSYIAYKNGKIFIVENKTENLNKYSGMIDNLIYSPNKKSLTYRVIELIGSSSEKSFIVKNGVEVGKEYKKITDFKYSPDGKSFVFSALKDGKNFIVKQTCDNQNSVDQAQKEESKNTNQEQQTNSRPTPSKENSSQIKKLQITIKSKNLLVKDLIISKKELEISKYSSYKKQVDALVEKITDTQLISVYNKLEAITNLEKRDLKYFIIYFKAKVGIEIYKREGIEKVNK